MIGSLNGLLKLKGENWVIIDVGGVGYKVFVTTPTLESLPFNHVFLYIYHYVKEDCSNLYGFKTLEELNFFELLLSISGIGPKIALSILSNASVDQLKTAIVSSDPTLLTEILGIGKKTAQRIILELKNKIKIEDLSSLTESKVDIDLVDALKKLGYSSKEIKEVIKQIPPNIKKLEEKVKFALRYLGK